MNLFHSGILAACVIALAGCATMRSSTINEDGSSHEHGVTVPPFSKQSLADFGFYQKVDADGVYEQRIGTHGEGIDNSGQIEAFKGLLALGQLLAPALAKPPADAPAADGTPAPGLGAEQVDQLNSVLRSIGERLQRLEQAAPAPVAAPPE